MSRKFRTYVLPLLLATLLITATAAFAVQVVQGAGQREAWLKLVTTDWNPSGTTLPEKYNLTGNWYFVEVYHERGSPYEELPEYAGVFYPNETGYVKITWPEDWDNVTVVVKAKTYEGTELGKGELYQGIIVYALYIGIDGTNATGVDYTTLTPAEFEDTYTEDNPYVAEAAIVFKVFHAHTWYDTKDSLSYAQIKIYDINHTAADSADSLLRAVVTDESGNSLYDPAETGELYTAGDTNPFEDNNYVPIPLQVMHLAAEKPISAVSGHLIKKPNLNATVRVWWETVLVNTTLYVPDVLNTGLPGPFTMDDDLQVNDLNSTVFYFACGARDSDLKVNGTLYSATEGDDVGSALFQASCKINLRDENGRPYHFMHELGKTDTLHTYPVNNTEYAISTDSHEWPGYLDDYRNFLRVPNATMWSGLYAKFEGIVITDGEGNSYNATDEVYVSKYYEATVSPSVIVLNDYLKTMTVSDDPGPYRGFRLEIEYAGGFRNSYGGYEQQVAVVLVSNPYVYVLKKPAWTGASGSEVEGAYVDDATPRDPSYNDGLILVPVKVADIIFIVKDTEGNLLHPDFTEVYLLRENGPAVRLAFFEKVDNNDATTVVTYEYHGAVTWPFLYRLTIDADFLPSPPPQYIVVAYQVPEDLTYGILVRYQGVTVYNNVSAVPKLVESTVVEAKATIYRLKVLFVDCKDRPLVNTPFWMYDPDLDTNIKFITGPDGGIDFVLPPKTLKFTGLYWKGVDVKFVKATFPNETSIEAAEDGSITIELTGSIRSPVKITALIDDIVFKTYDYAGAKRSNCRE